MIKVDSKERVNGEIGEDIGVEFEVGEDGGVYERRRKERICSI